MALADLMFQEASRSTQESGEGIAKSFQAGVEIALQKEALQRQREQLELNREQLQNQKLNLASTMYLRRRKIPPKARKHYDKSVLQPSLQSLGLDVDTKMLAALDEDEQFNMEKFVGVASDYNQALRTGDIQKQRELGAVIAGVFAGNPESMANFVNQNISQIANERIAQARMQESRERFQTQREESFVKQKIKFGKTYIKDMKDIEESTKRLQDMATFLEEAKKTNNFALLNNTIKNIVKQTDNRITDKDFELIASRPGVKGAVDAANRAAGKVPRDAVNDIIKAVKLSAELGEKRQKTLDALYMSRAKSISDMPGATQSPSQIMSEFQSYRDVPDEELDAALNERPQTPSEKGRELVLTDFAPEELIESMEQYMMTQAPFKQYVENPDRKQLKKLAVDALTPQGWPEGMIDQLVDRVLGKRDKEMKKPREQ